MSLGGTPFTVLGVLIGAVIFWNFFTRIQQSMTNAFLEDVWTRNLINLFSSPLTVGEYCMGLILTSIVTTILAIVTMTVFAALLFAYDVFQFGLYIIPFAFILCMFGWAMGIVATAAVLRMGPAAEILVWSLPVFTMPFSGVFYPISTLPAFIHPFSYLLPTTYVFESMRHIVGGGSFSMYYFLIASALSLLYLVGSFVLLRYVYRLVLRRGLFTRFMTE